MALAIRRLSNLIVVNNGHRDFVFATRNRALHGSVTLGGSMSRNWCSKNFAGLPVETSGGEHD